MMARVRMSRHHLGTERIVTLTFTKITQVDDGGTLFNAWQWDANFDGVDATNFAGGGTRGVLLFDGNGALTRAGFDDGAGTYVADATTGASVSISNFTGASVPAIPVDFEIDFTSITELAAENDVTLSSQNGFPRGVLESFNIGGTGTINGVFSNGLILVIGQVALANFANIGGLARAGNNLFRETLSSGDAQVGVSGTGGRGSVSGGVLEGSNVDLGQEFSNMIITQRGFQANARTITAADTLLQETVNLIR